MYYLIPLVILIFTAFKAVTISERCEDIKNEYITLSNKYEEDFSEINNIKSENEEVQKLNDSYNGFASQYDFADINNIKSTLNQLVSKYSIKDLSVEGKIMQFTIIADDGLKIDNFEIVKKTPYKDGFLYKMRSKND